MNSRNRRTPALKGPSVRVHVRCPVCTSFRAPEVLESPDIEAAQMVQTFAGKGAISWERLPLPFDQAVALRDRMREALARLDAEIEASKAAA